MTCYTYINVWRDNVPVVAYEVPEDKSRYWELPHRVYPDAAGQLAGPGREVTWRGMCRSLICYQAQPNVEINEAFTAWNKVGGWPVPPVQP